MFFRVVLDSGAGALRRVQRRPGLASGRTGRQHGAGRSCRRRRSSDVGSHVRGVRPGVDSSADRAPSARTRGRRETARAGDSGQSLGSASDQSRDHPPRPAAVSWTFHPDSGRSESCQCSRRGRDRRGSGAPELKSPGERWAARASRGSKIVCFRQEGCARGMVPLTPVDCGQEPAGVEKHHRWPNPARARSTRSARPRRPLLKSGRRGRGRRLLRVRPWTASRMSSASLRP